MLKLSDARNFSRTLAGIGLIAGPALFVISQIVSPAWADDTAEYLAEIADDEGLYLLSALLFLIGGMLLIPGMLGVIKLMRRGRKVTLGQVGAFLLAFGAIATAGFYVISVIEIAMVDEAASRPEMIELSDRAEESGGAFAFFLPYFFIGLVLGSILLGIAMIRSSVAPTWAGAALILSVIVLFVGGESQVVAIIGEALFLAALVPLGQLILGLSDDQWERWQVIEDEPPREPEAAPPATPAA
jgi:hypothetical protein